ncbi:ATP-binding protein [Rufibacter psychrotolerans]|uniref:ATP-binding protein n=1 Tax=Rufibacter psychrotolerans TaxID=2812556 RepID=UPI00196853A5|nr:ATP-binding protein [Rufibacter sp. SYSU D00308]
MPGLLGATAERPVSLSAPSAERTVDSLSQLAFELKRQDVEKALQLLQQAQALASNVKYQKGRATCYLYEAGIYQQNGYTKRALSLYYQSLNISHATKDTFNIARAMQQIASAFLADRQLPKAEEIYRKTLQNYTALKRWDDVVNVKNSLGLIELEENEFAHAEEFFTQALRVSQANQYQYGFKKAHFHLGLLYLKTKELEKAKRHFTASLELDRAVNDKYGLALSKNKLALVASQQGDYAQAVALATAALQDARAIHAAKLEVETMQNLVELHKAQARPVAVVAWQDSLIQKELELFERERTFALSFLDILKEKQEQQLLFEKEALLAEQKAKTTQYAFAIVMVVLLAVVLVAYLTSRNYRRAKQASWQLATKNQVIEEHSQALNQLNKNITQQNESLEAANQMKDKLLSILSHDLKAPLTNTKGLLQHINSGQLEEARYRPLLLELEKQYVRSLALLENVLFWIKSQMQGDVIRPRTLRLKPLLQEVIEEQELAALHKSITILNQVDPDLRVQADPEVLRVVFRNLLSNAVKFTRQGGNVTVWAQVAQGLQVRIEDEGIGIGPEALHQIRRKSYFTTKGTHNERGSGFGLMICEGLLRQHGGELVIDSRINEGSVFTVKLPASAVSLAEPLAV